MLYVVVLASSSSSTPTTCNFAYLLKDLEGIVASVFGEAASLEYVALRDDLLSTGVVARGCL